VASVAATIIGAAMVVAILSSCAWWRESPSDECQERARVGLLLCSAPAGTSDEDLIKVAGTRWAIEECS